MKKIQKILLIIMTIIVMVVSLIVPTSADTFYTSNYNHYTFRNNGNQIEEYPRLLAEGLYAMNIAISDTNKSRLAFVYDWDNNGNIFKVIEKEEFYIELFIRYEPSEEVHKQRLKISWDSPWLGYDDYIEWEYDLMADDVIITYSRWLSQPSFGSTPTQIEVTFTGQPFNFQLWINWNRVSLVSTNGTVEGGFNISLLEFLYTCFPDISLTPAKTYSEGLAAGTEYGYENGYIDGEGDGLLEGYTNGYNQGYTDGDTDGYNNGYNAGNLYGYEEGFIDGEDYGYDTGFGNGQADMAETESSFKEMVFAIFDAPVNLIDGMLNFDIFGINLAGLVKTVLTLAVVALIVFAILKFVKG